jgi:filamentous hemagglutinin family protein
MSRVLPPYPPYSGTAAMVVSTLVWAALPTPLVLAQSITPATDGTGTQVVPNGSVYDITGGTQSGDGANLFHSFQQFGLTPAEVANFIADPAVQNILARVTGGNVSVIDGLLQVSGSDANLYLINPAGILFGPNAVLNLDGSFTATSASAVGFGENWLQAIGDADYARLTGNPTGLAFGDNAAALINAGNLAVPSGETLALVGGSVINTGTLTAPGGQIVVMAVPGENLVRITPEGARLSLELATLPEAALPETSSGLTPLDIPSLLRAGGEDVATGLTVNEDGTVSLTGSERPLPTTPGSTIASGNIDASGATGGTVYILGELVGVVDANVDAAGEAGGGTILVGGDYQGQGPVPNARRTYIDADSTLAADAVETGDGGTVIAWADEATQFAGLITAQGGSATGDGGFVEVSGRETLDFQGYVDTSAPNGDLGTLLLDPASIVIQSSDDSGTGVADALPDIFFDDFAEQNIIINKADLEIQTADVVLQATDDIFLGFDTDPNLNFVAGGAITFKADADGDGVGSFVMNSESSLTTAGPRDITISGATIELGILNAGGGDITLIGDVINLFGGPDSIRSSGDLSIRPVNSTTDIRLGLVEPSLDFLDLTISDSDLDALADGFSTVTIGNSDITGDITLAGDVTFSNTFSATLETGGSINTSGFSLAGTGTTGLTLTAGNSITTSEITTEGQGISIIGDADGGGGEGPVEIRGEIASNGGLISISGASITSPGFSTDSTINSGGGNISLFGTSDQDDGVKIGVPGSANTLINSGGGNIDVSGASAGLGLSPGTGIRKSGGIVSQGGDITFNGISSGRPFGAGISNIGPINSGGGNISFSGSGDIGISTGLGPETSINSQGGNINFKGTGTGTFVDGTAFSGGGIILRSPVDSAGGNITFDGTGTNFDGIAILATDFGSETFASINSGGGNITFTGNRTYDGLTPPEVRQTFSGIYTETEINSEGGNIAFTGTSIVGNAVETSAPINSGGGAITFTGTSTRDSGIRTSGEITSGGGDIVFTGSTRDIDGIWATAPINSGGGNISFTGNSTNFHGIHFRSLDSQGGAITLVGNSDLSEGIFGEGPMRSGGGTVDLTANRSSVDIQDITTTGGDINIQAETFILANTLDSSNNSPGGNISLEAPGGIQVNSINTQGSTTGGAITVNTGGRFQALGSFVDRAGVLASLSSWGGISGGPITLIYGPLDFTLGEASGNGTQAAIHSKDVTLANASFSGSQIFGAGTPGRVILNVPSGGGGNEGGFPNEGTFLPPDPQRPEAPPQRTPQNALTSIEGGSLNDQQPLPEQEAHDQFANYFGDTLRPAQDVSIGESQATLRSIQSQTGEVPAFLYVRFNSEVNARLDDGKDPAAPILELLLITPDDDPKRVQVLHINRQDILATQEKLRRQITNPNLTSSTAYLQAAQQLYNWIIAPIQPDLEAAGVTNIGFIMDSGLRTLPLAALHDGEQFLVERYSLGLIPSVGLIDTEYVNLNRQTSSLVVAGSAEFINQPALWAANLEMQTIHDFWTGSALTGADFTVAGLQKTRQQAGIIHMATHAEFLRGAPSNSYLQFFDRRLRLSEVPEMGWYAPQVELVTLSACQTAMGNLDAELGFAGFALQAGAKSALASLWKVSDEATAGLMVTFYQQLDRQATKAETLRQAQLAMIRGEVYTEGGQLVLPNQTLPLPPQLMTDSLQIFSHPFYWAAFTMVGSPW